MSEKVTPTTSGLNYYFFPSSALWHPCCLVYLLFGSGDDEPVSKRLGTRGMVHWTRVSAKWVKKLDEDVHCLTKR